MTLTKEEFHKIYKEHFEPTLKTMETEFLKLRGQITIPRRLMVFGITAMVITTAVVFIVCGPNERALENSPAGMVLMIIYILGFISIVLCTRYFNRWNKLKAEYSKLVKDKIISNILSMYGKFYFSDKNNSIPLSDIHSMGFFHGEGINPDTNLKCDDDIIIGTYKGVNILINECRLVNATQKNRETIFAGLILKIPTNKEFKGKTFIGPRWYIKQLWKFEPVKLESVDLIKSYEVYSTDQIEARYLLTPSFIERMLSVVELFKTGYGFRIIDLFWQNNFCINTFGGFNTVIEAV